MFAAATLKGARLREGSATPTSLPLGIDPDDFDLIQTNRSPPPRCYFWLERALSFMFAAVTDRPSPAGPKLCATLDGENVTRFCAPAPSPILAGSLLARCKANWHRRPTGS